MQKKPTILLVEDDHFQRKDVRIALEGGLKADVRTVSTEFEFLDQFDMIACNPPDIAVVDRMLRWANAAPDMPPPPEGLREDAGLRCVQKLRRDARTNKVKIVLYSVLGDEESGAYADYPQVVKEPDCQSLIDKIKEMT